MMKIKIGNKRIGKDYPVYIIAEGCDNHLGSLRAAKECVEIALKNIKKKQYVEADIAVHNAIECLKSIKVMV